LVNFRFSHKINGDYTLWGFRSLRTSSKDIYISRSVILNILYKHHRVAFIEMGLSGQLQPHVSFPSVSSWILLLMKNFFKNNRVYCALSVRMVSLVGLYTFIFSMTEVLLIHLIFHLLVLYSIPLLPELFS
jgi:hypothetical protein